MKVVMTTGREKILAGRYLSQWLPDGKKPTLFFSLGLRTIGQSRDLSENQQILGQTKPPEAAAGHNTLVLRKKTLLASMAHECTDRTSRRAEIPPPEESTKGGGRWRNLSPVHSCAMLAKSVFFLKTKVLCPAAASGGFVRP